MILPTFNSQKTLPAAIKSIVEQSFSDFEILIMDGMSTDNTVEIARSFEDDRIKIFSSQDSGVYDAMNKGIDIAGGEWLYFLGSDDELADDHVFNDVAGAIKGEDDVLYGNVISDRFKGIYDGLFTKDKLYRQNICHQAIFFRKTLFAKTGLFDLRYKAYADWDHNIKWLLSDFLNKRYIERVIANYADNGLSSNIPDHAFETDKAEKFLQFRHAGLSKSVMRSVYLALAIKRKEDKDIFGFLFYKLRFWVKYFL